jgi:teichuronopeptide biosynthesis TupA-like protein
MRKLKLARSALSLAVGFALRSPRDARMTKRLLQRYYQTHGRLPNLFPPRLYSEKIQYRKLFDRRPFLTETADKYAVRGYASRILGEDLAPELYFRTTSPATIPFDELPRRFVVKATHGSGWQQIVLDRDTLDRHALITKCEDWLTKDFSLVAEEPFYAAIPRQIIVEEFLDGGGGRSPADIKCLVFNNRVRVVQLDVDRYGSHRRNYYGPDWKPLPIRDRFCLVDGQVDKPGRFHDVVRYAEALSRETDFVRVDFYQVGTRIYLGEMTHTPGSGLTRFYPESWDARLGEMWEMK